MKEWFSLGRLKSLGMDKLVICLLAGIFLLVICIPTRERKEETGIAEAGSEEKIQTETEELEGRLAAMLQKVQGVGRVEVMITMNGEYNQIEGVAVVAEGADSPQVRQDIIETAQALFPIAAHKIKVCKRIEESGGMK